jgi:hypothetical protein
VAYQDIPAGVTPGAGAGSGEVITAATDTTGNFLNTELTVTAADITKTVVGAAGTDQKTNLSLPNVGPGASVVSSRPKSLTTDHAGRVAAVSSYAESDVPAAWDSTLSRYFLIDNDGGSDSNTGYVDATPGATIVPTALAKKTINGTTGLMSIIPKVGSARMACVLMMARPSGATYQEADTSLSTLDLSGISGYGYFTVRGSTDLTNTTADRLTVGAIQGLAGPNGNGSWTVAAGATTSALTVAAGTLPAETVPDSGSGGIIGMRIRFVGDVTAGLANVCTAVYRHTAGTGTITYGQTLGTSPATGDTFFIERPGVRVNKLFDADNYTLNGNIPAGTANRLSQQVVGLATVATSTFTVAYGCPGSAAYCFFEQVGDTLPSNTHYAKEGASRIRFSNAWIDETVTTREVGTGVRSARLVLTQLWDFQATARGLFIHGSVSSGAPVTQLQVRGMVSINGANYLGNGARVENNRYDIPTNTSLVNAGNNASGTISKLRVVGAGSSPTGGLCWGGPGDLNGIEFEGSGASPGLLLTALSSGVEKCTVKLDNLTTGAGAGMTGVGVSLSGAQNRTVMIASTVTVTGTNGDLLLGDGSAITTFAGLALTNIVDDRANLICRSGVMLASQCIRVTNKTGATTAVGDIVRGNATTAQVTSAQGDTAANAIFGGVMCTVTADNGEGYMVNSGVAYTLFDGTPTVSALAYLSTGTTRKGTTTIPIVAATNQKLRIGRVLTASGSTGRLMLRPELIAVNADGLL